MRIAIAGVPRAGKTTLALYLGAEFGYPLQHGDDLIDMGWSEASAEIARRMLSPGPWIVEGVVVSRALRKALAMAPGRPCDRLYFLADAREPLSSKQASLGKGCHTVHAEIASELARRGVHILSMPEQDCSVRNALEVAAAPVVSSTAPSPATHMREPQGASGSRWGGLGGRGFG